jgi:hypothetical protein
MSYRPLSPWKRQRDPSKRDRKYLLQASPDFDTPFVPNPPYPCYEPVVCVDQEAVPPIEPPLILVDEFGNTFVTGIGDQIVAD